MAKDVKDILNDITGNITGQDNSDISALLSEISGSASSKNNATQTSQKNSVDVIRDIPDNVDFSSLAKRMQSGEALYFDRGGHKAFKALLRKAGYNSPSMPTSVTEDDKWLTSQWDGDGLQTVFVEHRVHLYTNKLNRPAIGTKATMNVW